MIFEIKQVRISHDEKKVEINVKGIKRLQRFKKVSSIAEIFLFKFLKIIKQIISRIIE